MSTCPEMQDLFFRTMVTYNCKPMKTIKLILATVLGAVMCAPMGVKAQTAVVDAFKSAPAARFPSYRQFDAPRYDRLLQQSFECGGY